jgi:hypothetical protein
MNKITGEKIVKIAGQDYILRYTWRVIAEVAQKYGDNPNLFSPETIAYIASAGMREKHPEMTPERIMELSPPLIPFAQDIRAALTWAYFGLEEAPKEDGLKKNSPKTGFLSRIKQLFNRA